MTLTRHRFGGKSGKWIECRHILLARALRVLRCGESCSGSVESCDMGFTSQLKAKIGEERFRLLQVRGDDGVECARSSLFLFLFFFVRRFIFFCFFSFLSSTRRVRRTPRTPPPAPSPRVVPAPPPAHIAPSSLAHTSFPSSHLPVFPPSHLSVSLKISPCRSLSNAPNAGRRTITISR